MIKNGGNRHHCQHDCNEKQRKQQKEGADDSTDPTGLREVPPGWVHQLRVHQSDIIVSNNPGRDAEGGANDKTEDAQYKNEGAAVRLHASDEMAARF
jgi:hypothetical protein